MVQFLLKTVVCDSMSTSLLSLSCVWKNIQGVLQPPCVSNALTRAEKPLSFSHFRIK